MAKRVAKELELVLQVVKSFREGALIEQIAAGLRVGLGRRALQRRLAKLREEGLIKVAGGGRALRYYPAHFVSVEDFCIRQDRDPEPPDVFPLSPLSDEAAEVQALVTRPIQGRQSVGYKRDFLDAYQPNVTEYLNATEREKLWVIGKNISTDQLTGMYTKDILNRLLLDLSWNSSRLEGNTYSFLDTKRLLSLGVFAEGKSGAEAQMILNHKEAIEFLVESGDELRFNRYILLNLHGLLARDLLPDPSSPGRLRSVSVGISGSAYQPPTIPQQIFEMFDRILEKADQIKDPYEQAFFVMVHLPYLQPFEDVNKRTSRLAVNIPFIRHHLAPLSFVGVDKDLYIQGVLGVYEFNRIELLKHVFLSAYERSAKRYIAVQQIIGPPDPFRVKYRELRTALIKDIILLALKPQQASIKIKEKARELPQQDQEKFIECVEIELLALHEGNSASYRVSLAEFKNWQAIWYADAPKKF